MSETLGKLYDLLDWLDRLDRQREFSSLPNALPTWHPCLFDGLPPGTYSLSCPCPRHSVWC